MANQELLMVFERPVDKQNCYQNVSNINVNLAIFDYNHSQSKKHIMHKLVNNEQEWHPKHIEFFKMYKNELDNKIMGSKETDIMETK